MIFWDYKIVKIIFFLLICLCFSACSKKQKEEKDEKEKGTVPVKVEKGDGEVFQGEDFLFDSEVSDLPEEADSVFQQDDEENPTEELESLEELDSIIKSPYTVSLNEKDFVEKQYTDTSRNLKIMEYGEEVFLPRREEDKLIFIHKYKDKVIRIFYDSDYRLVKKEIWYMKSVQDSKKLSTEEYTYAQFPDLPSGKCITMDDQSLQTFFVYDGDRRVVEEEEILVKGKSVSSKKQKYFFKGDDQIPADYEYYEDGKLLLKRNNISKTQWTIQTYLEEGFSVLTFYENNSKIKEQYFADGELLREKEYK